MRRPTLLLASAWLLALATAWLLALAGPALAQDDDTDTPPATSAGTGGLVVRAISVGGEEVKLGSIPVGIDACVNDAEIRFEIDGVPDSHESIDVYLGESCNASSSRDLDASNRCTYVGNFKATSSSNQPLTLRATQLMGEDCAMKAEESTPKLWFLAVKDPGSSEDVMNLYKMIEDVRLDTRRPTAPTSVEGGSGEKQIPVEWKTSDSDLEGFVVLIDPAPTSGGGGGSGTSGGSSGSGGDDDEDGGTTNADSGTPAPSGGSTAANGECGSSVLTEGGSVGGLPSRIKRKEVNEATATGIDLGPSDIDGDIAAIAVVAVDEAGNESPLSALACVKVVPTESFWDRYSADEDAVEGGCPCAALGPAQLASAWPVGLALSLIALSARRRRRS
jgi:hypothetical protein